MEQESRPPDLKWPKLQWQPMMWLSLIPFALSFVVFFVPILAEERLKSQRILIGVVLLLMPVIVPICTWLWRASRITYQRTINYSLLHDRALWYSEELFHARKDIFAILQSSLGGRLFEITRARYEQGLLYIALNKNKSTKLIEGNIVMVVHKFDGMSMGQFEVTEVRTNEYYAVGVRSIDPLWLTRMEQQGEISLIPNMAAIYLPRGER